MTRLMQMDNPKLLTICATLVLFLVNAGLIAHLLFADGSSVPGILSFLEQEILILLPVSGATSVLHAFIDKYPPKGRDGTPQA